MERSQSRDRGRESPNHRFRNREHKAWKKALPLLYDMHINHALPYVSLTLEWLPDVRVSPDKNYTIQRVLFGTCLPSYVMFADVKLPIQKAVGPSERPDRSKFFFPESGDDDGEAGADDGMANCFQITQMIAHEGEVNKVRHNPSNPNVFATKPRSPDVFVFDQKRHKNKPFRDGKPKPQLVLKGHSQEGYALSWSPHHAAKLVSGGDDNLVIVFDVTHEMNKVTASSQRSRSDDVAPPVDIHPVQVFGDDTRGGSAQKNGSANGHTQAVEDVEWNPHQRCTIGSVGDDRKMLLWDTRIHDRPANCIPEAHDCEVNALSFNPFIDNMFVTADGNGVIKLWDNRKTEKCVHSLRGHSDQIYKVDWCPASELVLASCSTDGRVLVWDLARIGARPKLPSAAAGDGSDSSAAGGGSGPAGASRSSMVDLLVDRTEPPELMFIHGGHTDKVSDFSWNFNDPFVMASVSDNRNIQVWEMAEEYHNDSWLEFPADEAADANGAGISTSNVDANASATMSMSANSSTPAAANSTAAAPHSHSQSHSHPPVHPFPTAAARGAPQRSFPSRMAPPVRGSAAGSSHPPHPLAPHRQPQAPHSAPHSHPHPHAHPSPLQHHTRAAPQPHVFHRATSASTSAPRRAPGMPGTQSSLANVQSGAHAGGVPMRRVPPAPARANVIPAPAPARVVH